MEDKKRERKFISEIQQHDVYRHYRIALLLLLLLLRVSAAAATAISWMNTALY